MLKWSEFVATDSEARVRFPALPDVLRNSRSGTGSTQPREYNWGATSKKSICSGLDIREYGRRDPSRWPRGSIYPQKLALTSRTSGCRSVGIVRSQTPATEFSLVLLCFLIMSSSCINFNCSFNVISTIIWIANAGKYNHCCKPNRIVRLNSSQTNFFRFRVICMILNVKTGNLLSLSAVSPPLLHESYRFRQRIAHLTSANWISVRVRQSSWSVSKELVGTRSCQVVLLNLQYSKLTATCKTPRTVLYWPLSRRQAWKTHSDILLTKLHSFENISLTKSRDISCFTVSIGHTISHKPPIEYTFYSQWPKSFV
jgi:hypothetical protein